MKKTVRVLATALALALAVGTLAGCGLFGGKKMPEKQTVDHVYHYETQDLYTVTYSYDDENVTERESIYNRTLSGGGYAFLVERTDKDYNNIGFDLHYGKVGGEDMKIELPFEQPKENEDGYSYYSTLFRFEDGFGIVAEHSKLVDAETNSYQWDAELLLYGEDGTQRASIDLRKALNIVEGGYFSINNALMCGDKLLLSHYGEDGLVWQMFDLDGTPGQAFSILPEGVDGYVNNVFCTKDGKLIATANMYSDTGSRVSIIQFDPVTGERSELDAKQDYELAYSLFADANGAFYASDSNGIYTVDPVTLEKTEILNYINSDYIYKSDSNYIALEDGRFAAFTNEVKRRESDGSVQTRTYGITTFTKAPAEALQPKYIITVASAGYTYNLQEQIVEFNRASDEYRIRYVDYSQYNTEEDYNAGNTRLSEDILAGNVPDVLITDQEFSASKYVSKGLFADLYTFIDGDAELKREDFLANILEGCSIDGKLYELPTNFNIVGMLLPRDNAENFRGLTIREFADRVKALPEGVSFFRDGDISRDDLLQYLFCINYTDFFDPKTGKCTVNNDEGRALLELVKTLPEKSLWDREDFNMDSFDWDAYNNQFRDGKAIAQMTTVGNFSALTDYAWSYNEDTKLDFIGFPAPDGDGIGFTTGNLKLLISAKSVFGDAAWDFVRLFFLDEYQLDQSWGFPVKKTALEAKKQEMLDEIKAEEEKDSITSDDEFAVTTAAVAYTSIMVDDAFNVSAHMLTAEDVETICQYALSAKKQAVYDLSLFNIIQEEASAYFAGTKTADEVLPLMESRITIFLAEGR